MMWAWLQEQKGWLKSLKSVSVHKIFEQSSQFNKSTTDFDFL